MQCILESSGLLFPLLRLRSIICCILYIVVSPSYPSPASGSLLGVPFIVVVASLRPPSLHASRQDHPITTFHHAQTSFSHDMTRHY